MFRYNADKVLEHKKLGGTQHSWVCPYKEGHNENEWVVKHIYAKNQEEMNDVLQNIFLTTSCGASGIVPIKGSDVKANEQGDYHIYCKIPRMVGSLKNVIEKEYYADNLLGSTEKLVLFLHSLVSTLDELAQQKTFHRNIKLENVLFDKSGHPLLSDLKMIQTATIKECFTKESDNLIYIAPEVFSDNWTGGEDNDIHKADVWSLGMIMAKLCLLDKLTPIPTDVPLQESQEAIETNIEAIKNRCGANLAGVLADMLNIDPAKRKTFGEIRSMLEQTFLYTIEKEGYKKDVSDWGRQGKQSNYADSYYQDSHSDPFLQLNDGPMFRQRQKFTNRKDYEDPGAEEKYELFSQLEKHELYQKVKWFVSSLMSKIFKGAKEFKEGKGAEMIEKAKYYKNSLQTGITEKAKNFKEGKGGQIYEKAKELKGSIGSRIYRKFKYFKDVGRFQLYEKMGNGVNFVKTHKYKFLAGILMILFIIGLIMGLQYQANENRLRLEREAELLQQQENEMRQTYDKMIKGISIKLGEDINIYAPQHGSLAAELKPKYLDSRVHGYYDRWGRWVYQQEPVNYNENTWIGFLGEIEKELKTPDFINRLQDLRIKSLKQMSMTPEGLTKLANGISHFKSLKRFYFTQISGTTINLSGIKHFISSLATALPELEGFGIGLIGCPSITEINEIATHILTNFKNLKELTLEFEELSINDKEMGKLASAISQNGQSLTSLTLKVASCNDIETEGFRNFNSEFFKSLTNLTFLSLDYQKTKINNQAIFDFSAGISGSCKNLKSLLINVPECDGITVQAVKYLAHQLNVTPIPGLERLAFYTGGRVRDAIYQVRDELRNVPIVEVN